MKFFLGGTANLAPRSVASPIMTPPTLPMTPSVWLTTQAEDRVKKGDPKNGRTTAKEFLQEKKFVTGNNENPIQTVCV